MNSFVVLLLARLGYTGDPEALCLSALPQWPLLFLTGAFCVLAISLLLRSMLDLAVPPTITQLVSGSRSVIHWSITATALALLAATIEALGAQQRAAATEWLEQLSTTGHPMAVTGVMAVAAGLLMSARAIALVQLGFFRRPAHSAGPRGLPSDGGFVQASGFALRGFSSGGSTARKPGGGVPVAILGVVLAAYGVELLRHVDLCL